MNALEFTLAMTLNVLSIIGAVAVVRFMGRKIRGRADD